MLILIVAFLVNKPHDLEETGSLKTSYRTENVNIVGSICGYDIQNSNNSPYSEDYEFPILSLGFTKSLWVGGKTTNNDVLVSANFYPRPASKDFVAGPYNLDLEKKDFLCNFYNRVWVIKKWEVQNGTE